MQEQANELTEACLNVDRNMVHTMCNLADTMDHVSMGGSAGSSAGGWMAGVSVGVGWLGGSDRGICSKGKGKEKEQSEVEGDAGDMTMLGDSKNWGDDGGDDWSSGGGSGHGGGSDDDDDAPLVEYIG